MTTYYVSNAASNGYVVGNDSNDGLAKSTPKLTAAGAISAASASDTIIFNDGTYDEDHNFNKNCTYRSENSGMAVFTNSNGGDTRVINIPQGQAVTLSGLVLDAESTFGSCIRDNGTGGNITIIGGTLRDATNYGVFCEGNLTMYGEWTVSGSMDTAGVFAQPDNNDAQIVVTHGTVSLTPPDACTGIQVTPSAGVTGVDAVIAGNVISMTQSTGAPTGIQVGISTDNRQVDTAVISDNSITLAGSDSPIGISVFDDATLVLSSVVVSGNDIISNGTGTPSGGYGIRVGEDTDGGGNITAHTVNRNFVRNFDHGIMSGYVDNGKLFDNRIERCVISCLFDGCVGGVMYENLVVNPASTGGVLRFKDSTSCTHRDSECYVGEAYGGSFLHYSDSTSGFSGNSFTNNAIFARKSVTNMVSVASSQTDRVTFSGNKYANEVGNLAFSYGGSSYSQDNWPVTGEINAVFRGSVARLRVDAARTKI